MNSVIKKHRLTALINKTRPKYSCLQETHFSFKDTHRLKVKDGKRYSMATGNQKRAEAAIIILDKVDFKSKAVAREKKGH